MDTVEHSTPNNGSYRLPFGKGEPCVGEPSQLGTHTRCDDDDSTASILLTSQQQTGLILKNRKRKNRDRDVVPTVVYDLGLPPTQRLFFTISQPSLIPSSYILLSGRNHPTARRTPRTKLSWFWTPISQVELGTTKKRVQQNVYDVQYTQQQLVASTVQYVVSTITIGLPPKPRPSLSDTGSVQTMVRL